MEVNILTELFHKRYRKLPELLRKEMPTLNEKYILELIRLLSKEIQHDYFSLNSNIYKLHDKVENFYIILRGKAAFLEIRESKIMMTEKEYTDYIKELKKLKEVELIKKIILTNKSVYNCDNILSVTDFNRLKSKTLTFNHKLVKTTALHDMLGVELMNKENYSPIKKNFMNASVILFILI